MNSVFLQFYKDVLPPFFKDNYVLLQNGFSYVWDEAHPIWLNEDTEKLPIEAEKVYVSVVSTAEISKVWKWAKEHPQIQFIVGGPAIWPGPPFIKLLEPIPHNLTLVEGFAESIFNRPVDLKTWKLSFPIVAPGTIVCYTYHMGDGCDWSKCIFCCEKTRKIRELRGYDIEPLWDAPPGVVFLVNDSLKVEDLYVLEKFNYSNKKYRLYIRATDRVYEALKIILPRLNKPENLAFQMGVEFPSDRMYKWMNKGTTIREVSKVLRLLSEYGCYFRLSYISDWPNLTDSDITSAKDFFDSLENCDSIIGNHYIRPLLVFNNELKKYADKEVRVGPFVIGYTATLTEKEKLLNNEWKNLVMSRQNVYDGEIPPHRLKGEKQ